MVQEIHHADRLPGHQNYWKKRKLHLLLQRRIDQKLAARGSTVAAGRRCRRRGRAGLGFAVLEKAAEHLLTDRLGWPNKEDWAGPVKGTGLAQ